MKFGKTDIIAFCVIVIGTAIWYRYYYYMSDSQKLKLQIVAEELPINEPIKGVSGSISDHDYVDLGLPSGLKWATCNLGATIPTQFGDKYSWGNVSMDDIDSYTKYRVVGLSHWECLKLTLKPEDDAATSCWGSLWRMPSFDEYEELQHYCEWIKVNSGYIVKSKINGNTMFIPFAESGCYYNIDEGAFWLSSAHDNITYACAANGPRCDFFQRHKKLCVRAVVNQ